MTHQPGDDVRLSHSGRFAARDIVQFVPFARFSSSPALLAQETLAEIPRQVRPSPTFRAASRIQRLIAPLYFQVQEYFASRSIHPRPPPHAAPSQFPYDPAMLALQHTMPQASAPPP